MKKITQSELNEINRKHVLWANGDPDGKRADLSNTNCSRLDFSSQNWGGAIFEGANLSWADLSWADLAIANLSYVKLTGTNLACASLARAILSNAKLTDAKIDYQIQPGLGLEIAKRVLADPELLSMRVWHAACGTKRCLAGWACTLSPVAAELEKTHGTQIAALLTLGPEWHSHFFDSDIDAIKFLKQVVERGEA